MWCATRFSSGTSLIYFVHKVSYHCHLSIRPLIPFLADDFQLQNLSTPSDFPVLVHSLKDCVEDVAEWMCDSVLKMNHDKTELIAIGTKPRISQVTISLTPVSISGHNIPCSQSVRSWCLYR